MWTNDGRFGWWGQGGIPLSEGSNLRSVSQIPAIGTEPVIDTSRTVTKPAGTVDGDIMVTFVMALAGTEPATRPAGWTLRASVVITTSGYWLGIYTKTAATEGASYIWNAAAGVAMATYQNVTMVGTIRTATSASGTTAPALTNTDAKAQDIIVGGADWFSGGGTGPNVSNPPASFTERVELAGSGAGNRAAMGYNDRSWIFGTNVPTVPYAFSVSGGTIRQGILRMIAFKAN